MNCDDMQEWILESAPTNADAQAHLSECEACRDFLRIQQSLDEQLTHAYPAPTPNPDFRARLQARIRTEKRRGLWNLAAPAAGLLTGAICAQLAPAIGPLALAAGLGLALTSYLGQLLFTWLTEELGEG